MIRNISVTYSDREKATEVFKNMLDDINDGGTELCFMTTKSAKE